MGLTYFWKQALANMLLKNQGWVDMETCKKKGRDPMAITLGNTSVEQVVKFVEDLMDCDEED